MRRVAILVLLLVAMAVIQPLGVRGHSETLLVLGFLVLAAYTIGEIAASFRLPKIVGYLVAGLLFGPSGLDTVDAAVAGNLAPVSRLAVAIIAFLAGAELDWAEVRKRGLTIVKILGSELTLCFLALLLLLVLLRPWVPFFAGEPWPAVLALAVLFASVAIVHSPAVTIALLSETRAKGEIARTTLGVVLVADVVVVLLFSGTLALARAIAPPPTGGEGESLLMVIWGLVGSVVVGAALGGVIALYLRFVQRELVLFAIVATMLGAEVARLTHVEALLTLLIAGFVTELGAPEQGIKLRHAMERAAAPVFVVFFALAGEHIELSSIGALLPIALPVVLVRALAIRQGAALGARWAGLPPERGRLISMGLVSQAGVALGLATVVADVYPSRGTAMAGLFLAMIAINESVGPILFRWALGRAGEIDPAAESEIAADPVAAH